MKRKRVDRSHNRLSSPFATYLKEVEAMPLLTAEAEVDLANRYARGDMTAREHLIRANLRLVISIARCYRRLGLDFQDLIEEGNLGLMRAVEKFNPSSGNRLSTYASLWIKQHIRRALSNQSRSVRVPDYLVQLLLKWKAKHKELEQQLKRPPTDEEMRLALGVSKEEYTNLRKASRCSGFQLGFDCTGDDSETENYLEVLAQLPAPVENELEQNEIRERMFTGIARLDKRRASVLRMRYGLDGTEPKRIKEIANALGVSEETVRKDHISASQELREKLREH